jgi:hypothetical protein
VSFFKKKNLDGFGVYESNCLFFSWQKARVMRAIFFFLAKGARGFCARQEHRLKVSEGFTFSLSLSLSHSLFSECIGVKLLPRLCAEAQRLQVFFKKEKRKGSYYPDCALRLS